jgi:hypothetical protein
MDSVVNQYSTSQRHSAPLKQKQAQNPINFTTFEQLRDDEKIEVIQTSFCLNQEKKISLKKYYEGTGESTLFDWKGYQIKFNSIRKTKLYKQLKAKYFGGDDSICSQRLIKGSRMKINQV